MKIYTQEEMLDIVIGVRGTDRREEYERDTAAFRLTEMVKETINKCRKPDLGQWSCLCDRIN